MITHAVILAAGKGSRIASLNLGLPKPLICIGGKPIIERHLEDCARSGITHVFINLHHLAEEIKRFVGNGVRWGLKVKYNFESELLGTAGAVKAFEADLRHGPFTVIYGDNYCTFSLGDFMRTYGESSAIHDMVIALYRKQDVSSSGVAICDQGNRILRFVEKPVGMSGEQWVNAGLYIVQARILKSIPESFSDFGRDIIPRLILAGHHVQGVNMDGTVFPVDDPVLLGAAQKAFGGSSARASG